MATVCSKTAENGGHDDDVTNNDKHGAPNL
jgi:hypothetical protein